MIEGTISTLQWQLFWQRICNITILELRDSYDPTCMLCMNPFFMNLGFLVVIRSDICWHSPLNNYYVPKPAVLPHECRHIPLLYGIVLYGIVTSINLYHEHMRWWGIDEYPSDISATKPQSPWSSHVWRKVVGSLLERNPIQCYALILGKLEWPRTRVSWQ